MKEVKSVQNNLKDKQPSNLEAEQSLLGSILVNNDIIDEVNEMFVGAIKSPTMHVNNTKDITLGFIKCKNDCRLKTTLSLEFLYFVID